jgi:hypothetical protein
MDQNAVPTTAGALRQKRDELYRAAREHPGSEEDEMVEILLLSAMSNLQPVGYDAKPGMAIGEDRRRFHAARERTAQQHRARQRAIAKARERSGPAAEEDAPSVAELRREVEARQRQLERVEEALKGAQAAMAAGKQMTDLEIYNRIAAVVGLVPPSEPTNFSS